MKKTLLSLLALTLAATLAGCRAKQDMTSITGDPTSSASPSASPNVTTVMPNVIDGVMNGVDGMMNGTDGTGSMNGADGVMPDATLIPEATGVTTMDKARRVIEQIEDELERLSEVEDAEVIIAGNKAAVGLTFDDQYQAGLDDRLRKIVKERVDGVVSGISTLAITADQLVTDAIEALGERLDAMSDMAALESDLDAIIRKINGPSA